MQARYYDPIIGRFLSTDPIGYQDQLNLYAYVHNDPVNLIDPSGMCTGSRITTEDGTCAITGGFNTGTSGVAQGMQIDRAIGKAISDTGNLNYNGRQQRELGSAFRKSGASSVSIIDVSYTISDGEKRWEAPSENWSNIASGRASPRAFVQIPEGFSEIRVEARVVALIGDNRAFGGGVASLWRKGKFIDNFAAGMGARTASKTWQIVPYGYPNRGYYSVRFDFAVTGDYDVYGR